MSAAVMRQVLEDLDVARMRKLWATVRPGLPQPPKGSAGDRQMVVEMHLARTISKTVRFKFRAYSHAWLLEHGYPSALPDELRPKAQQLHPVVAHAVGIAVKSNIPEVGDIIRRAMMDVVENCYADGKTDPLYVRTHMLEARKIAKRKLLGSAAGV